MNLNHKSVVTVDGVTIEADTSKYAKGSVQRKFALELCKLAQGNGVVIEYRDNAAADFRVPRSYLSFSNSAGDYRVQRELYAVLEEDNTRYIGAVPFIGEDAARAAGTRFPGRKVFKLVEVK